MPVSAEPSPLKNEAVTCEATTLSSSATDPDTIIFFHCAIVLMLFLLYINSLGPCIPYSLTGSRISVCVTGEADVVALLCFC